MTPAAPETEAGTAGTTIDTPVGRLRLRADATGLTHILLPEHHGRHGSGQSPVPAADPHAHSDSAASDQRPPGATATRHLRAAARQLEEYFAGARTSFDLPLSPTGGTAFQRQVWLSLADIGYGRTESYADLATRVGRPRAFRAVGQANGANPLPIVLPCHRVVASGGGLGGYGGGLDMKRWLLAHEAAVLEGSRLAG
jgi:methylated-DNA-[protein]-cysteine S-methyltransferase